MDRPRLGIVGLGRWGKKHLSELLYLHREGTVEFVGVCDSNPDAFSGLPADTYRCLKLEDIVGKADGFIVATSTEAHYNIAYDLVANGKAVLLEKPIVHSEGALDQLTDMVGRMHGVVIPGHLYRFSDLIREAKAQVMKSMNPLGINFRWTDFFPIPRKTDIVMDLMPHVFDICKDMFGVLPDTLSLSYGGFRGEKETCVLKGSMGRHLYFSAELSYGLPQKHRSIEVVGMTKALSLDLVMQPDRIRVIDELKTEEIWVPPNNTLRDEQRFFARAVVNKEQHIELLQDAAEGMRMLFKTRKEGGAIK